MQLDAAAAAARTFRHSIYLINDTVLAVRYDVGALSEPQQSFTSHSPRFTLGKLGKSRKVSESRSISYEDSVRGVRYLQFSDTIVVLFCFPRSRFQMNPQDIEIGKKLSSLFLFLFCLYYTFYHTLCPLKERKNDLLRDRSLFRKREASRTRESLCFPMDFPPSRCVNQTKILTIISNRALERFAAITGRSAASAESRDAR